MGVKLPGKRFISGQPWRAFQGSYNIYPPLAWFGGVFYCKGLDKSEEILYTILCWGSPQGITAVPRRDCFESFHLVEKEVKMSRVVNGKAL